MTFSIIIPAFNVEVFLPECLASVLAQSFSDWEAIIVDDGSNDNTGKIADYWMGDDARIKVLHQSNQGPSTARNFAIQQAQGDYLLFLDADDAIKPYALERLNQEIQMCHPDIIAFGSELWEDNKFLPNNAFNPAEDRVFANGQAYLDDFVERKKWGPSAVCFYLWRRKMVIDSHISFPCGVYHEDDYYVPVILLFAHNKVVTMKHVLYSYRMRSGSIVHNNSVKHANDTLAIASMLDKEFARLKYTNSQASCIIRNLILNGILSLRKQHQPILSEYYKMLWFHTHSIKDFARIVKKMLTVRFI